MAGQPSKVKVVLEHTNVSPPPGSVPDTSLPLSFFDLPWLLCRPMQCLFFYQLPHSTPQFIHSLLPSLKSSLSHTLKTFYPFAAKLICPPSPQKPHILYTDGDFVPFTVVESSADFDQTTGHHVRDVKDLHPFVPELPRESVVNNNTRVLPLLALQVTVFPNSGICIGVTFYHVVADGRSFYHFMKFWAYMNSAGGGAAAAYLEKSMPFLDRNVIQEKDPSGVESILLNDWWSICASNSEGEKEQVHDNFAGKVRTTFVMARADIDRLKRHVLNQCVDECGSELPRASTFVVACALVWTCLIKTQQLSRRSEKNRRDDDSYYFCFLADCRNRPELDIPGTYLGNCLAICFVTMMRSELVGENAVLAAAKAIGNRVVEFENGVLRGEEKWIADGTEILGTDRLLTVSGSPKFRTYDTDFGWGRPKKTEVVHIDSSSDVYLGDCAHEEGAVEIGLALKRDEMEVFSDLFEQGLKEL